jgi:hypothetical protein
VEKIENIVKRSGVFFASEEQPSTHHVPPQFHHHLTTKTPRSAPRFFQNTPQKHVQKQQNPGFHRGSIFFLKTSAKKLSLPW